MKRILLLVLILSFALPNYSYGKITPSGKISFFWKGKLISVGDAKIKVINLCGEPLLKEEVDWDEKKWETWTYDYSYTQYVIISFLFSKVKKMELINK